MGNESAKPDAPGQESDTNSPMDNGPAEPDAKRKEDKDPDELALADGSEKPHVKREEINITTVYTRSNNRKTIWEQTSNPR